MQQQPTPKAETPYAEPEIIPPGADWPRSSRIWISTGPHHTTRIQLPRLGPVGIALFVLLIGILALFQWRRERRTEEMPPVLAEEPVVTVLIAAFNEERVIGRTVETILQGDYRNIEVVVVDDGSRDRTYDVSGQWR